MSEDRAAEECDADTDTQAKEHRDKESGQSASSQGQGREQGQGQGQGQAQGRSVGAGTVSRVSDKGQNGHTILCQHCPSVILAPNTANFVQMDFSLPYMTQKRGVYTVDREDLTEYWSVDDIYTFENAGFTNTTENVKYLGCADCESGPIGYVNLETKVSYVALSRVRYQ